MKRKHLYVKHKHSEGHKTTHIIGVNDNHTVCGIPSQGLGNEEEFYETVGYHYKAKPDCPYCLNNIMYYAQFIKHINN